VIVKEFVLTLTVSGDTSRVDETWVQSVIDEAAETFSKRGLARVEDVVVTLTNEEPL